MTETIVKTRCVFAVEAIVYEDGNVEMKTRIHEKKNLLGRKNHVLSQEEQMALLLIIKDKLEETFPNAPVRLERVNEQPVIEETVEWPKLQ